MIDGTLTSSTALAQSEAESNGNERMSLHFPNLFTWILTPR